MNKFNLLAQPYSTEQLMEMVGQEIAAAEEAYVGVAAAQTELHEVEHAFELIQCQYNMLSLVADKPGALEALNVNGAIEAICDKKLADITAEAAVEGLGQKVLEVLKTIWEKIKALVGRFAEWLTNLFNAEHNQLKVLRGATSFTDRGRKVPMCRVSDMSRITSYAASLASVYTVLDKALTDLGGVLSTPNANDYKALSRNLNNIVSYANGQIIKALGPLKNTTWFTIGQNRSPLFVEITFDRDKLMADIASATTLEEAGIKSVEDAKRLGGMPEHMSIERFYKQACQAETNIAQKALSSRGMANSNSDEDGIKSIIKDYVDAHKSAATLGSRAVDVMAKLIWKYSALISVAVEAVAPPEKAE